jgi:N-formylglutamate deformylase
MAPLLRSMDVGLVGRLALVFSGILACMKPAEHEVFKRLGMASPLALLVLDSPHSGTLMPPGFAALLAPGLSAEDLRDGEDCFVDALYEPAAQELGIPLLAAQFPRTFLDANRHAADIDPALLAEPWPGPLHASGKAAIGKALVWRTLDDGRPIHSRLLSAAEVQARIEHYHAPYHAALRDLLDAAVARHGRVLHLNCHSMNAVSGAMGQEGAGCARADVVLGDRDGSTCAPAITRFVQRFFESCGYEVRINDPFKGVELVRAYAAPAQGRHSLQVELNKRLYLQDGPSPRPNARFATVQGQLLGLLRELGPFVQTIPDTHNSTPP